MRCTLTILTITLIASPVAWSQTATPDEPCCPDGTHAQHDPALPPGHPDISSMLKMNEAVLGQLAIRAVQGTPGGPSVGAVPVDISLVHNGHVVHTIEAELDEYGVVVLEDLPITMELHPVVQVQYAGVSYQETGPALSPKSPSAMLEVVVYEVTEERPDWRVAMRHVMIERSQEGLLVTEMVVTENPADRTWLGDAVPGQPAGDHSKRPAARFSIPPNATDIHLHSGFHGWCCTALDDSGMLFVQMPMMSGQARYRFTYTLEAKGGLAELFLTAPVLTNHIIAFFADDDSVVSPTGMSHTGTDLMGTHVVRFYQAAAVAPNQVIGLTFSGLTTAADLAAAESAARRVKTLVGIGGGVLLLAGIAVVFLRPVKTPVKSAEAGAATAATDAAPATPEHRTPRSDRLPSDTTRPQASRSGTLSSHTSKSEEPVMEYQI